MRTSNVILLCLTPLYIWVAELTAFIHEFAHSFMAWGLGFKENPWNIIYGGTSWQNVIFLANIDENVNYHLIDQLGHGHWNSLIAFAGPGIGSLAIYLISLYFLYKNFNKYLYYLVFWINLVNLRELWAYVPIRALSSHADIANINMYLGLSPWWIFILVTPLVIWGMWNFFFNTINISYKKLGLNSASSQAILLILSVVFFFCLTYLQIFMADYNFVTRALTLGSFLLIPFILYFGWPKSTKRRR